MASPKWEDVTIVTEKNMTEFSRKVGLAMFYDTNYSVEFNILFWVSLFLGVAVAGIAVWIWHMDPGKDSLIYRMTTTRLKKD